MKHRHDPTKNKYVREDARTIIEVSINMSDEEAIAKYIERIRFNRPDYINKMDHEK